MLFRFTYPVLFSVAGVLFFLLPLTSTNKTATTIHSNENYSGSNTFTCVSDPLMFDQKTPLRAEVTHHSDLFHLNLWIGKENENRITFVLRDEEIHESAYALDHPSKRYFSFLLHGKHCTYSSDDDLTGMLMIHKYDTTNKIIAGSFEFMAYADDCDELVRINHGMFDATYLPN
jgi:Family of unknown function (DUF6252)